jgi:hypothetical protein
MGKKLSYLSLVTLIFGGITAVYFWKNSDVPAPKLEDVKVNPTATPSGPRYTVPKEADLSAENAKMPSLDESDPTFRGAMIKLFGKDQVDLLFNSENLVRRLVVTVTNSDERRLSPDYFPLNPLQGKFLIYKEGDHLYIDRKNDERYLQFINLINDVSPKLVAKVYLHFYPLFQSAYAEISNQSYFNDRLVVAIDHLLSTPEINGPIELLPLNKSFGYADESLEHLSGSQKMFLRVGLKNEIKGKEWLRQFRNQVILGQ